MTTEGQHMDNNIQDAEIVAGAPTQPSDGPVDTLPAGEAKVEEAAPATALAAAPAYVPAIVMTPELATDQANQIREMTRSVLIDGTDYGLIPGAGTRKVLLKPGAEWLLKWYGFGHRFTSPDIEHRGDDKWGVTYRCEVTTLLPNGEQIVVATCDGYCSYDESKYLSTKSDGSVKYKAPWNTIIKMAQKRALVGATLQATGTSGLFTQDLEDYSSEPIVASLPFDATPLLTLLSEDAKAVARETWKRLGWPKPSELKGQQALEIAFVLGQFSAWAPSTLAATNTDAIDDFVRTVAGALNLADAKEG